MLAKRIWGRHLWARGYFAASSGNVTDEFIAEYIGLQGKKKRDRDDDFTIDGVESSSDDQVRESVLCTLRHSYSYLFICLLLHDLVMKNESILIF